MPIACSNHPLRPKFSDESHTVSGSIRTILACVSGFRTICTDGKRRLICSALNRNFSLAKMVTSFDRLSKIFVMKSMSGSEYVQIVIFPSVLSISDSRAAQVSSASLTSYKDIATPLSSVWNLIAHHPCNRSASHVLPCAPATTWTHVSDIR